MKVIAWPAHKNADRNPYNDLLYRAVETAGTPVSEFSIPAALRMRRGDILHIHWPDAFLAAASSRAGFSMRYAQLRAICAWAKVRRVSIIWTSHNLKRGGQRYGDLMNRYFWPWWAKRIDGVIYPSETSRQRALATFPGLKGRPERVAPLGHFLDVIEPGLDTRTGMPVIAYCGTITKYKDPSSLVRAFAQVPSGTLELRIEGEVSAVEPDPDFEKSISAVPHSAREYLTIRREFLTDSELTEHLRTADLVAFPYQEVLNSAAILYALSVGRPVLATKQPAFEELQSKIGQEFVWLYEGTLSPSVLQESAQRAIRLRGSGSAPDLSHHAWAGIAATHLELYAEVSTCSRPITRDTTYS